MAGPHSRGEINSRQVNDMGSSGLYDIGEDTCGGVLVGIGSGDTVVSLEGSFPEDSEGDGDGSQDLGAEGIEDDEQWGPGVLDRCEGDEGCFPLDAGERSLVACFEVVERTEDAEDDGADGRV